MRFANGNEVEFGQVGLGEVAVIVRRFLGAQVNGNAAGVVPAAGGGFGNRRAGLFPEGGLALDLELKSALDVADRVDVLYFGF